MGARAMSSFLMILIFAFSPFRSSEASSCGTAVYWGQNGYEGSLRAACSTVYYKYVNVAFLTTFGGGQTPVLDLAGHCTPSSGNCVPLSEEISFCQSRGIKVLLSLGGSSGRYLVSSPEDAEVIAKYIYDTYLAGNPGGPLGDAALDGVDFDIEYPISTLYWDDLAKALAAYSTSERKIYLAAAPQCPHPDRNLDAAIKTGLFDYVWVQFYNNPQCDYSGGASNVIQSWNEWSSSLPATSQLLLGLPAAPQAASTGYIAPQNLIDEIFPEIKLSPKYGGIMLWSRYWDIQSAYTVQVTVFVCYNVTQQQQPYIRMISEN